MPPDKITYELDLRTLYLSPAQAVHNTVEVVHDVNPQWGGERKNRRSAQLIEGLEKCGASAPLVKEGRLRTMNGPELFYNLADNEVDYYPSKADKKIFDDNIDHFANRLRGEVWLDVCSGHADKNALLLEKMLTLHLNKYYPGISPTTATEEMRLEAWPTYIVLNDIVSLNLQRGNTNLKKKKYPAERIFRKRADVLDPGFWRDAVTLIESLGSRRPVVTMQGATFNDFSARERKRILQNFRMFPPGSHLMLSVDNTTNVQSLRKAYVNARMRQFLLTAAEHYFYARARFEMPRTDKPTGKNFLPQQKQFQPHNALANVEIKKVRGAPHVFFSVEDANYKCTWNTIEKIPVPKIVQQFQEAGIQIAALLPLEDQINFPKVDYAFYDVVSDALTPPRPSRRKSSAAAYRR